MFVVAGVTGNTGSVVARTLRAQGKEVRVLVRNEGVRAGLEAQGFSVEVAPLEDREKLTAALRDAEGAYFLVPPYHGPEILKHQRKVADSIALALRATNVPRVVLLSSIAAQQKEGTGPILSVHYLEQVTEGIAGLTYLRAAYFQQNWLGVLGAAQEKQVLPSFLPPSRAVPMVATDDIGTTAAELLLQKEAPPRIVQLAGPSDHTSVEVAGEFAAALGHSVTALDLPVEQVTSTFVEFGVPEEMARLYQEMYTGMQSGIFGWQSGLPVTRGKTRLRELIAGRVRLAAE